MLKLDIDYDETYDAFAEIRNVKTDLIWGDPAAVPKPWLSYIIPVYQRADLLKETLWSVLNQQPVDFPWDIVVVDNETQAGNPTEQLIREMNEPRILYYRNRENLGPGGNYNRCIETARGEWVALLHGDDLILDDHLLLMGQYIRRWHRPSRPVAYISPRSVDFSDKKYLKLSRSEIKKDTVCYFGRLKRLTMLDIMMTGNTVNVPSFGTVMNREIMLKEGGFQVKLGICEDVITPYKLSRKYGVYTTPKVMGYYRFDRNACTKRETIFEICEHMTDFREYLIQTNVLTRLWGKIVRPVFFQNMTDYCSHISRYGDEALRRSDFSYIYSERPPMGKAQEVYYQLYNVYALANGYVLYNQWIKEETQRMLKMIKAKGFQKVIIYGAGRAGSEAVKPVAKDHEVEFLGFAVTSMTENEESLRNHPVRPLSAYLDQKDDSFLIITTTVEEFAVDMYLTAEDMGFRHKANLLKGFRRNVDSSYSTQEQGNN